MIRKFLKSWFIDGVALGCTGWLFKGLSVSYNLGDFFLASLALTLVNLIIKPIFNLIFLPINIITLGLLRWLKTVASLGLTVYLIDSLTLNTFYFPGLKMSNLSLAPFTTNLFISLIISSFIYEGLKRFIFWLLKTR